MDFGLLILLLFRAAAALPPSFASLTAPPTLSAPLSVALLQVQNTEDFF